MDFSVAVDELRAGEPVAFPSDANTLQFASALDAQDPINLRDQFILPTRASLKKKALNGTIPAVSNSPSSDDDTACIYFVGNSLGAQPKAIRKCLDAQLETWASIGVNGHFSDMEDSPLTSWQDMAEDCAKKSADIVGANPSEIVIMNTLTINLHLMMASFYKPEGKRNKIILEWKPYTIESQIRWHGLDPAETMVQIQPNEDYYISTEEILATIDKHADETALLLLPGIQFYSGQLFDMKRITAHAKAKGIVVGWDLAHAAGNVELYLHDWNVDFACWCTYKYINAGPGSIAGAFVHEKHGKVDFSAGTQTWQFRDRLAGWYGHDKRTRFNMDNKFQPTVGAGGYQVSNPSAIDLASLTGALSVFAQTKMKTLRSKALLLTAYAEHLLNKILVDKPGAFRIITPKNPLERGTQLSVLLKEGLLDDVSRDLEAAGVICDKRKPGVIRVAPVPLYCTFTDVWKFMDVLRNTLTN
ncbi:kynureninase [Pseudomassariella vexata]|uniref:Kynureninase n=1 Tax=Pseudomassariella vexata TaxID=1141098 RepID=A0A1Y2E8A9_9PEZI|nr:kynureninase [Pseudomassariella vexata]ORY67803.1 kynureninase [Pseudomassariella vexata]